MPDNPDSSVSFAKAAALSPVSGYLYFRKTTESGVSEIHSIETLRAAIGGSDLTVNTVGVVFNGAVAITSPADVDLVPVTQASVVKKITWANIKVTLKTYFDSLYATAAQGTKADNALPASSYTAADVLTKIKTVDGTGSGLDAALLEGSAKSYFATATQGTKADDALPAASYTAADVLTKIKTVDGAGSGLDADTIDGSSLAAIILACYPVGAVYISVLATSPATLFGGTWSQISQGRVLVGQYASDARFDVAEEFGGAYNHVHSSPVHDHGGSGLYAHLNLSSNSRVYGAKAAYAWTGNPSSFVQGSANTQTVNGDVNTQGVIVGGSTADNAATNTGSADNIMPYLVVYMWKRTA